MWKRKSNTQFFHETSPIGLTNQLQVWWGGDFDPPSEALALKFQEIAWETVMSYPNSCLNSENSSNIALEATSITVLPNPATDYFVIEGLVGNYTIQILDALGNIYQTL